MIPSKRSGNLYQRFTRASRPPRTNESEYENPLFTLPEVPLTVIIVATRNRRAFSRGSRSASSLRASVNSSREYGVSATCSHNFAGFSRRTVNRFTTLRSRSLTTSIGARGLLRVTTADPQKTSTHALCGGSISTIRLASRCFAPKYPKAGLIKPWAIEPIPGSSELISITQSVGKS